MFSWLSNSARFLGSTPKHTRKQLGWCAKLFKCVDTQTTFFDSQFWFGSLVPLDSMYGRLHQYGELWFRDEDYQSLYKDSGLGRPCCPPSLLVRALILQNYKNLSDRGLADAIRFDVRFKFGLNLPINHDGFDYSLFSVFRARLIVNQKDRDAFERSLEVAKNSGVLTKEEEQAMDSAPIIGAAALQDTFTLLRTGIEKTLRAIDRQRKAWEGSRNFQYPYQREKYLSSKGKPDIEWDNEEKKALYLQELVVDARLLLTAIDQSGMKESKEVRAAADLLTRIIAQDIDESPSRKPTTKSKSAATVEKSTSKNNPSAVAESDSDTTESQTSTDAVHDSNETAPTVATENDIVEPAVGADSAVTEEGKPELPVIKRATTGRILSTNDTDMRHGRKSKSKLIKGYKSHITTTVGTEIVTSVVVTPANVSDGEPVPGALDQLESRDLKPDTLYGDGAYGSADLRQMAEERGVEIVSKLPSQPAGEHIGKRFFEIRVEQNSVTCPEGVTTTNYRHVKDDKGREVKKFRFDAGTCQGCALRDACIGPKAKNREITLHYNEEQLQKAMAQNATPEFREEYKTRLVVERVQARLQSYGLRNARYFSQAKVQLQALFTATANNFWRVTKILDSQLEREAPT